MNPWPGAYFDWKGAPLKVHRARVSEGKGLIAGSRITVQGWPAIATGEEMLILEEIQPAGKKSMPGKAFLAGARDWQKD
jgi:methionyl-tRNA formyltransferase